MATVKKAQDPKKVDKSAAKSVLMEKYKLKKSIANNYDLFNKGKWETPEDKASNIKKLNESAKKDSLAATKMKSGGKMWMQKVSKSIKARGTEGKCTPITKPGCTGKAKTLAKTFKKIAAKRKAK
jgi:hypothetical protein